MVAVIDSRRPSPRKVPVDAVKSGDQTHTVLQRPAILKARLPFPVLVYLLTVVVPIGFNVGQLAMTSLRAMLLIMVLPLLVQLFMGKFGRLILTDILFILHIGWAGIALASNNPAQVVQQIGSVGMEFIGGYLVGRAYIRTAADFAALCRWMTIIICVTFPLALVETVTGRPLMLEAILSLPGVTTVPFNYQEGRLGLERVQMGFAHPIHFGLFCAVAFSLAFVGLKGVTNGIVRYITSAAIGLSGFLALSSGALLAMVLQIGLIIWAWIFGRVRHRWLMLLGLFILMYIIIEIFSNRSPVRVFMSYATFSAHTAYWRSIIFEWGMKSVWANPILGIGLNDWVRPFYMYSGSMDNFWLVMAVRYGIPGFLLLAIGYVIPIWRIGRRDFSADTLLVQLRRSWMFSFMGLTFTLCTVHVWTNIYSFVFFMFGAGIWMITVKHDSTLSGIKDASDLDQNQYKPVIQPRYTRFPIKERLGVIKSLNGLVSLREGQGKYDG